MCGFAGFIDFNKKSNKSVLHEMVKALNHRGPDDFGIEFLDFNDFQIGFCHARLSILDLSVAGHQPMIHKETGNFIVYNGEVYNFKEVRKELIETKGISFNTESDTEVILKAFAIWGMRAVDKFIGMFSFVLFDNQFKKVYFCRDRAGVKPLYYHLTDEIFLFGSELKVFAKHPKFNSDINLDSVASFLQKGWIPAPHSIFKDTFKLMPGHYAVFDLESKSFELEKYWDIINFFNNKELDISENEAEVEIERLLKSSCEYRMVSDVPVGVFLSGGYDSSAIAAILQSNRSEKIKTFTIGFEDEQFNEAIHAKKVAEYLGTEHFEYYCNYKEALSLVDDLPFYYDEPFADSSAIPTMLVSKIASQHVKVSLSADGGDELFAGYSRYTTKIDDFLKFANLRQPASSLLAIPLEILEKISRISSEPYYQYKLEKIIEVLKTSNPLQKIKNRIAPKHFSNYEMPKIMAKGFNQQSSNYDELKQLREDIHYLQAFLAIEFKTTLVDDMLVKVDRATMRFSLEGREPMLDHRLVEFAASLPHHYKVKDGIQKRLLKNIVHRYIPKNIMDRPKMGFAIPTEKWLKGDLKSLLYFHLSKGQINKFGILNYEYISELLKRFENGKEVNPERLWIILMLQMWLEKWKS
jgi:asparagine synthase (glutamine-hydrolysing)